MSGLRARRRECEAVDGMVAGRFDLERVTGSGGAKKTFRAYDRATRRTVSLDVVHLEDPERIALLDREARAFAALDHPAIARVVAHGVTGEGIVWAASEWCDGETLEDRLERGPLGAEEAIALGLRLAGALAEAHARGLAHGAVHPSCVLVGADGARSAKLAGFGRASANEAAIAQSGAHLRLPRYVAPEQECGDERPTARADVFALGSLLRAATAGKRSGALDAALARMTAADPGERPADGAEAVDVLESSHASSTARNAPDAPRAGARIALQERPLVSIAVALCDPCDAAAANRARGAAGPLGARVDRLDDGTIVAVVANKGSARDQAARAVRCAAAVRDAVGDAPMAIATGRAQIEAGLADAAVHGAVQLARRPRPARRARAIAVDDATAGLLGPEFEIVGEGGARFLAGRDAPSAANGTDPARTLLGRPTPFVGREREAATLLSTVEACVADRRAHAVLVTSPSGVGKSRLRDEVVRQVGERFPHVQVWVARGDPMTAGAPFGMLAQVVREVAGVEDDDGLRARQSKLVTRLSRHLGGDDLQRVAEFLGELAGIRFPEAKSVQLRAARRSAVLMGDQMRRAWEDFLAAECVAGPVLIVLDDLHWGDAPTVGFLHAALRRAESEPLMVLALARPDVDELFPRLWEGCDAAHVRLGELPRRAAECLVRATLGESVGEDTVAKIVARAAGNVFCLEELVRSTAEGREDALPGSVLAMVQDRLERLGPNARRLLRAASLFGATFWRGGVAALLQMADGSRELSEALGELVRAEMITARDRGGRFRDEHAFRHAIVRDAAYDTLTEEDRQLGHALAAQWLERAGETDSMTLAEQYERGGDVARAGAHYVRAARQSLEGNDLPAVVARAQKGVTCGASAEDVGALRVLEAEAHRWRGELAEAERCASEAALVLPRGSAPWFDAASELAATAARLGDVEAIARLVDPLCGPCEPSAEASRIAACASTVFPLLTCGRADLARRLLDRLDRLDVSAHAADPNVRARIHIAHATAALFAGDQGACLEHAEASIEAFDAAGDLRRACLQRMNAGFVKMTLGAYDAAESMLRQALASAERMGLASIAVMVRHNLGLTLALRGALHEARAVESLAVDMALEHGDVHVLARGRIYLAEILRLARNFDGAARETKAALDVLGPEQPARADALATLALVRLAMGRTSDAIGAAEEAARVLERHGSETEGHVRLAHAEVLHACGRVDEARAAVSAARKRLLARAARIGDAGYRRSFLEQVPEHARTMQLAREWGG